MPAVQLFPRRALRQDARCRSYDTNFARSVLIAVVLALAAPRPATRSMRIASVCQQFLRGIARHYLLLHRLSRFTSTEA